MELSAADRIWNRAALESGGRDAREGDRALSALLLFHGLVMNGGLGHGCTAVDDDDFIAAIAGYRYFGFDKLADFLESIANLPEEQIEEINDEYCKFVPDDSALAETFEAYYHSNPSAFAPLNGR